VTSEKAIANLGARFALLGYELHTVVKAGRVHYEVRQSGQTRTCSTLHDLEGLLAVLGARTDDRGTAE
jgi:hypothetical protein